MYKYCTDSIQVYMHTQSLYSIMLCINRFTKMYKYLYMLLYKYLYMLLYKCIEKHSNYMPHFPFGNNCRTDYIKVYSDVHVHVYIHVIEHSCSVS